MPHTKYTDGFFQDIYFQLNHFSLSGLLNTSDALVFQDDSENSFEALLLMTNRIYHKKENNYQKVLHALSESMEQLLISWYQHAPLNMEIEQMKNTIIDSFTDPEFSIAELLSGGAYCTDHLRRLFKKSTGLTPLEYLTELRINNTKKLMQENNALHYTIAEISMLSGFYDSGYFSRIFKKKTNMTPTEYVKQITPE